VQCRRDLGGACTHPLVVLVEGDWLVLIELVAAEQRSPT
jgi:hypothetical protein